MKLQVHKLFVLALIIGVSVVGLTKSPAQWVASTLNADKTPKVVSWFDENYTGEELEISLDNPDYDGILLYINDLLKNEHVEDFTVKKYIKDILTLRRGPNARIYMKRMCRIFLKDEVTEADAGLVAQSILKMIAEEPGKDTKRIRAFVDELMFPDARIKTRLGRARSTCEFFEDAHKTEKQNQSKEVLPVSIGLVRYLLQNNITYPIPGLLKNVELSDEMKALILQYKNVPDLAPLVNVIEQESVSLASFQVKESEFKVVDVASERISEVKEVKHRNAFSDNNLPPVPDFSTPVRR